MLLRQFHYFLSSSSKFPFSKSPTDGNLNSVFRPPNPTRRSLTVRANLITNSDSFEVGRLIGSYGFMNITSYSGFQSGEDVEYSSGDLGQLRFQDVGEGSVKIRLYEGRVSQGSRKGTPLIFKVYPGKRAGGVEADMMAANELNAHAFLQSSSKDICSNLALLVGGFETNTGEQWFAFRDDGRYSAADYGKIMSERISKRIEQVSWNPYEQEQLIKRRRNFVIRMFQGIMRGLVYMHDRNRLHQSIGPSSVVLNTIVEKDAAYLIPRLRDLAFSVDVRFPFPEDSLGQLAEGLWRRATVAGAYTPMEKRAFGIADDIYGAGLLFAYLAFVPFCESGVVDSLSLQRLLESTFRLDLDAMREYCLVDDRFVEAVKFLDLNDRAGWQLLQAMLNPDFRQRPFAEGVLNHRFLTATMI